MADKMAIVVFSGSVDRLLGMSILASSAAAMDWEVDIFLQLWGVYAFKKDVIKKNMNFSEFEELKEAVVKRIQELNFPMWYDILKQGKETGNIHIYACSTAAKAWNVTKDDLEMVDDLMEAGEFIEKVRDAKLSFFV